MKSKFKIGDRVIIIFSLNRELPRGSTGTVKDIMLDESAVRIGVEWDKHINGHTCDGTSKLGHGYYVYENQIKLLFTCENDKNRVNSIKPNNRIVMDFSLI